MLMPCNTASPCIQGFFDLSLAGATPHCHINKVAILELNSGIMQTSSSLCSWAYNLVLLAPGLHQHTAIQARV